MDQFFAVLSIVAVPVFFVFCWIKGGKMGTKVGNRIKESRESFSREDVVTVQLLPHLVLAVVEHQLDNKLWQKDRGDDATGYVYVDSITAGFGAGFGVQTRAVSDNTTEVTIFPYQREMSITEQVHRGVHGTSGFDVVTDVAEASRSWIKIAPVRDSVVKALSAYAVR